jgi:sec-independent protein translocase protein TatB
MFGMGTFEIMIIAAVALVVLGPEKFPEFAKIATRAITDIRSYFTEARDEITKELRPVKRQIEELSRYDPEDYIDKLADTVTEHEDDGEAENRDSGDETNEEHGGVEGTVPASMNVSSASGEAEESAEDGADAESDHGGIDPNSRPGYLTAPDDELFSGPETDDTED